MLLVMWMGLMTVYGQQDPMYTQYMFNTLSVNPAYAGSREALSFVGLYRTQWVGLPGAPVTQTFTVHTPVVGKHAGWGLSVVNDVVGPIHQTQLFVDYSYELKVSTLGRLRLGLKGGLGLYSGNLEDEQHQDRADPLILDFKGKLLPNIGVGIYYSTPRGYIGLSAPKLIRKQLELNGHRVGQLRTHWFLIGGYLFDVGDHVTLKPSFLVKAVSGAPLSVDLTGMAYLYERLGLGASYRMGDSFSVLAQLFLTPGLYVGYAHDFTTTPLKAYGRGTHEITLGYDYFWKFKQSIHSPRFF
jgi:type IX secretion system PorP/SprF family membrane protein